MFRVRSFGNDALCGSIEELRALLRERYTGMSVSIVFSSAKSGIKKTLFVDVDSKGHLCESYGQRAEVSLDDLLAS